MQKLLSSSLAILLLAGCAHTPKLPDPTAVYPKPPAALMEPSRNMQPIPTGENIDSSQHTS